MFLKSHVTLPSIEHVVKCPRDLETRVSLSLSRVSLDENPKVSRFIKTVVETPTKSVELRSVHAARELAKASRVQSELLRDTSSEEKSVLIFWIYTVYAFGLAKPRSVFLNTRSSKGKGYQKEPTLWKRK